MRDRGRARELDVTEPTRRATPRPRAARGRVDGRGRRRGRSRRAPRRVNVGGHAERRRARRAGRLLLDRLRLRRREARAVRRVRRAGAARRVRPHEARRRARRSRDGLDRPLVLALRADRAQLRPHDAAARRGARRGRASSTTSAAAPTYVGHLAAATRELLDLPGGIWHVAADGDCTWAEFAEAIFEEAGLDVPRSADHDARSSARPAPRPAYSVLRSERPGAPRLPHWREGLRACLARLGRD